MTVTLLAKQLDRELSQLDTSDALYATHFVDLLLASAGEVGASDIHLQPTGEGLDVRWRLDGVLQSVGGFSTGEAADVISRLKVLAELLTYRNDVPQEGRIRNAPGDIETRVSTFPSLYGERAVVRLFSAAEQFLYLDDLGLPGDVHAELQMLLSETSGVVLVTGPAGSGKTTTAYACLRELVRHADREKSVVTLEDPIEVAVPGTAQSQVNATAGFDLATGLRSIMRQDPEVILVGEIRDRDTAQTVFQASLTGHLVLSTFHAGSAAGAIGRLSDMGIEPYLLRSGILAILNQRLMRRLCQCAQLSCDEEDRLGLKVKSTHTAVGCEQCRGTGYRGRMVLTEMITPRPDELGRAILSRSDVASLEQLAITAGTIPNWQRACRAVEEGLTSAAEVRRVFGFSDRRRDEHTA